MKTLTVYCDKDLVFRWNEWPENNCVLLPITCFDIDSDYEVHVKGYDKCVNDYIAALEVAKRESIPIHPEDQRFAEACAKMTMPDRGAVWEGVQPDTFYSFPFEGEVKRGVICDTCGVNDDSDCDIYKMEECDFVSKEVARLIPPPTRKQP